MADSIRASAATTRTARPIRAPFAGVTLYLETGQAVVSAETRLEYRIERQLILHIHGTGQRLLIQRHLHIHF